ncbi:DUF6929 family protein [Adhaeribacter soli]|uniref:Esterase-like activity of phytase family protein n=1 Tax=Adhaeribacter soli TaxID=2607655 RepID=A0A5N1IQD8_9BACT|nr:hypothetical protein [Adhaeribacter soli]KAA9331745.1 hypothetical protein F0P94_13115 [Adhaeribacter soli]
MKQLLLVFCFSSLLFSGCKSANEKKAPEEKMSAKFTAIVQKETVLDSIPSGSGLVFYGEHAFIITDDSPYFFRLSRRFDQGQKFPISNTTGFTDFRIPKALKPDYESALIGEIAGKKCLVAFGSGSKSPERDSLLVVALDNLQNPKTYSLKPLYELIKTTAKLTNADMNVEASALAGEYLYLFNRGHNVLVQLNWRETIAFITEKPTGQNPQMKTYRLQLPNIQGVVPGLSGACQLGNENKLLFTASVENTQNWIADGEILGSFIGILNLDKLETEPVQAVALLTDSKGKAVIEKVESIEYAGTETDGTIRAFALTDDDKGGSKILEIRLRF